MLSTLGNTVDRLRGAGLKLPFSQAAAARVVVPALLGTAAVTALVVAMLWRDQSSYKPMFGVRDQVSSADVISVLETEHIAYRIHPETGQVMVADKHLGQARLLLAAKGVVGRLPEGLELVDRNDPLGVSQFVQDVRFRRGLEGELVKSISSIDAVESARVHLSIARSSSFVVNTGEKSSASVLVVLKQGRRLSQEQIAAIINLVAGSVSGLDPKHVTLTDQAGNLLSARVDLTEGYEAAGAGEAERRFSEEARRNAQEMLTPLLGEGNYRISVTAAVDNDRVEETRERYNGDPRIINEATREENDRNPVALGVPGSLSNRPVEAPSAASAADRSTSRAAVSRSYAYDRSITQIKRSKGRLTQLTVALVLNDAAAPGGKGWSKEQIERFDKMMRSGLGIDANRGDQLTVSTLEFPAAPAEQVWWKQPQNIFEMVEVALSAIGGLLVFLLLRSALRAFLKPSDAATGKRKGKEKVALATERDAAPGHTEQVGTASAVPGMAPEDSAMVPLMENVDLPPAGSPVDVMIDHLRSLADKEPARVAEVVKQWVQKQHGQS